MERPGRGVFHGRYYRDGEIAEWRAGGARPPTSEGVRVLLLIVGGALVGAAGVAALGAVLRWGVPW